MNVVELRDKLNEYIEYGVGDLPIFYSVIGEDDRYEEIEDGFINLDTGGVELVNYNIRYGKNKIILCKDDMFL